MLRPIFLAVALAAVPAVAQAQTTAPMPAATPYATPAPSPTPPGRHSIGRALEGRGCGQLTQLVDRPTITQSSCTVPANRILIEAGYNNNSAVSAAGGSNTVSYPNVEVRIGSSVPRLEFDVITPSVVRRSDGAGESNGIGDVGAGFNYQFTQTFLPARVSISGIATAPTGSGYGSSSGNYIGNLNLGGTLGRFALDGTVGFRSLTGIQATADNFDVLAYRGSDRYETFVPSLEASTQFGRLFGRSPGRIFVEAAHFSRTYVNGRGEMVYDGGYKQAVLGHGVLDVEYTIAPQQPAFGANTSTINRGLGAGLSYLF